jgi:hypothetical protein
VTPFSAFFNFHERFVVPKNLVGSFANQTPTLIGCVLLMNPLRSRKPQHPLRFTFCTPL